MFAHSGVQHILCCVFLRLVYHMLPVSLDCPFLIAHSVFSKFIILFVGMVLYIYKKRNDIAEYIYACDICSFA